MADTMTPISDLLGLTSDALNASVTERLEELGSRIQAKMTESGSGELDASISTEVRDEGDKVTLTVYAEGENKPWRYQDRDGNWHTTTGMKVHPFLQPELDSILPSMDDIADDILNDLRN